MNPSQSIIAIVENLNNPNMKEIFSLTHVDKFAVEKEVSIVPIHVLNVAIKENVYPASTKVLLFNVNAEKVQEWLNVVNKDRYSNAGKNVRKYWTAANISAKKIVIMANVLHARKNT